MVKTIRLGSKQYNNGQINTIMVKSIMIKLLAGDTAEKLSKDRSNLFARISTITVLWGVGKKNSQAHIFKYHLKKNNLRIISS